MNERIKELAKQASDTSDYELECVTDNFLEHFAERIIKECANLCQCEWNGDADTYDSCDAYNECADMILEHFGVEK